MRNFFHSVYKEPKILYDKSETFPTLGREEASPMEQTSRRRSALLGALILAVASQVSMGLEPGAFTISLAVVLLPLLCSLWPGLPVVWTMLLAAPGVFLLRALARLAASGTLAGSWNAHAPEMVFYVCYGLLFELYRRKVRFHPFSLYACIPLAALDALSNLAELLIRVGADAFHPVSLGRLLLVGICRSLLAWCGLRLLDGYGFQLLRREDAQRYQRLLLMTASLKSEVAWMDKGTALIENTMNRAYHLYSRLRDSEADPKDTQLALSVATDIHEVKKEYFLIMRGISEALETENVGTGMEWRELAALLGQSVTQTAQAAGKQVLFQSDSRIQFYTLQHHYLMSIFHNLLSNAVEAASDHGVFHISLTARAEGDDYCFTVRDDCGGIPPERLEQIFLPGFSSKINYTTGAVNRGLGLPLVKGLVEEKLHGTIGVDSGGGCTTFTIRIPKSELEASDHALLSR